MSAMVKPYCEYNCDYPCTLCLEAHRNSEIEAAAKRQQARGINPLMDDSLDEYDGYLGAVPRFTDSGAATTPYVPPPLLVLQKGQLVEPNPIPILGARNLAKRKIVVI